MHRRLIVNGLVVYLSSHFFSLSSDFRLLTSGKFRPYRNIIPGRRRALQNRGSRVRGCVISRKSHPMKNRSAHIGITTWSPVTKPGGSSYAINRRTIVQPLFQVVAELVLHPAADSDDNMFGPALFENGDKCCIAHACGMPREKVDS
jgi:hypothetical protein